MKKNVLVISSSPRAGGNSDTLCDQLIAGCEEAGHAAQKIALRDKQYGFCRACYACRKLGSCVQRDDLTPVFDKMERADVIVLATPVYFYSVCGQLKTLMDRCLSCAARLKDKEFIFIATAADGKADMERAMDCLRGFTDCLPGARIRGSIYGEGAWKIGDIVHQPAMEEARLLGKNIGQEDALNEW